MGFTAPLFVSKINPDQTEQKIRIFESEPINYSDKLFKTLKNEQGISQVSPILYRPTILQSKKFQDNIKLGSGKDTVVVRQEIAGVLMKGVDEAYNWEFIEKHLKDGKVNPSIKNAVVLSEQIANNLDYQIGDTILASFFTTNRAVKREFIVTGIFNTGFGDYDQQLVFTTLDYLQEVSGLDFKIRMDVSPILSENNKLQLEAIPNTNEQEILYYWNGLSGSNRIGWEIGGPKKVELVALTRNERGVLQSDTAVISFEWHGIEKVAEIALNGELLIDSKGGMHLIGNLKNKGLKIMVDNPFYREGSKISGYELGLTEFETIEETANTIQSNLHMKPDQYGNVLQVTTVKESESDLFAWLDFLDINVYIIITLMLIIGIVNVGSAILVIIVVRTNFVGVMKALGATNWSIRKIFVYEASNLIFKGLLFGNSIGIVLCYVQQNYKLFSLDPSVYYLNAIPIHFSWWNVLIINLLTCVVCFIALVIPSMVVTRISPIKSIKFN